MPYNNLVDLACIRVAYREGRLCVILEFADSVSRLRQMSYAPDVFLSAVRRITGTNPQRQLTGWLSLGFRRTEREGAWTYWLQFPGGSVGNVGNPTAGALKHLLQMLDELSPFRQRLLDLLASGQEAELRNPFYTKA